MKRMKNLVLLDFKGLYVDLSIILGLQLNVWRHILATPYWIVLFTHWLYHICNNNFLDIFSPQKACLMWKCSLKFTVIRLVMTEAVSNVQRRKLNYSVPTPSHLLVFFIFLISSITYYGYHWLYLDNQKIRTRLL